MKKVIAIFLLAMWLSGVIIVHADHGNISKEENILIELNIVDEGYFSNFNTVTREECLVAIMRVIGVTDKEVDLLNGADFVAFEDTYPYSYFGCAYRAKIAYGEECIVDYPTYRTSHTHKNTDFFFFPQRAVTVKETIAFMVRCLEDLDASIDLNTTLKKAVEYGLIDDEDALIQNPDSEISQKDFYILIERFLQQRRYKFYQRENNVFRMEGNVDEKRSISYLNMLQQREK
ncbi:hypothetical protein [Acetivibrio sp. MSJd-27]|uniref:hypothetical protein n=1 Tax=Acetivibrio sp. MSJd-27 TaxID=2841523 RepID=UPI001C1264DB|nr:hypothetical protein [Acetivibrio sp. MSJd-27]MBU5451520.1 hypothetical protein [Acetivibrio sp. MSJd-27]